MGFSGGRDFLTGLMARLTEKSGPTAHQCSGRASGAPGKARANGCHLLLFGWADGAPRQAGQQRSTRRANGTPGKARANGCHLLLFGWADGAPRQARANSAPPAGPMAHLAKPGPMAVTCFCLGGLMAHLDKLGPTALHPQGQWHTWQSQGQWLSPAFVWVG